MIGTPTTISLDGDDWSVYWLPPGVWESLRVWESDPPEAAGRRIPASVPGHAQQALLASGQSLDRFVDEVEGDSRDWESQQSWVYEKRFPADAIDPGAIARLRFEGIDDAATVFLNGERLGRHEGQFIPWEAEVTTLLRSENHLVVVVELAEGGPKRRWKTRFDRGTDFRTGVVPVGIWDSVSLVITGRVWFDDVTLHANLSIDRTEAAISIVCGFGVRQPQQCLVRTEITQSGLPTTVVEDACTVFTGDTVLVQSTTIPRAQLWWPNGYGRQSLYEARISLLDYDERLLDLRTVSFGLREVEAVRCEGAAPDTLPYRLRVNGRDIWIKGWNWVPLDLLYAGESEERYERFLRLAKAANVNLLRVWAGGLIEKDVFYRLCDRVGIMVWQDFPQLGTAPDRQPPSDPEYLEYIETQAESILARRRSHPSLVLWCGGGDLFDSEGLRLGSDYPALATLRDAVAIEDPQRLWIPSIDRAQVLPPADSDVPTKVVPGVERSRPAPTHAGVGEGRLCTQPGTTLVETARHESYFEAMQLQIEIEAARQRKWQTAGTLPWCFNEPYPYPTGPSAIDYHGQPKLAYYAVKRAYAPFHVSAAFPSFAWDGKTAFTADLWLHNSGAERTLLNVVAVITDLNGRELYQENLAAEAPENAAESVGDLSWRFPAEFAAPFVLWLEVIDEEGETIARNAYLHSRAADPPFAALLTLPETRLEVERTDGAVIIRNVGPAVALAVEVAGGDLLIEDSGFHLCPDTARQIRVVGEGPLRVSAWNAPEAG